MPRISNADQAIKTAHSFLLAKYPMRGRVAKPVKATPLGDNWVVEFNVGIVRWIIATLKLRASTGEVIDYDVPIAGITSLG